MEHFARLVTPRLLLRPPQLEDFQAFADFCGDPVAMRFLAGAQPRPLAWRTFMTIAGSWRLNGFGYFSVIERNSGKWIGRVGPWSPEGWPGREVGWALCTDRTGQGFALEAAQAAMDWAFEVLGWDRIIHCIEEDNEPSIKVALRLGSRLIGETEMPPPIAGHIARIYGQSRDEWIGNRKGRGS